MSADSNLCDLAVVSETSFGQIPAGANLRLLRLTGESITGGKETVTSAEVRGDRQINDIVMVGTGVSGALNFELSLNSSYIDFLLAAMGSAGLTTIDQDSLFGDVDHTAQTLTIPEITGLTTLKPGGYVRLNRLKDARNNGMKRFIGFSGAGTVMHFAPGSFFSTSVDNSISVYTQDARIGTMKPSFTVERRVLLPPESSGQQPALVYQQYTGCTVDEFNLTMNAKQIITGSVAFMGKRPVAGLNSANTLSGAFATSVLTCGATDPVDGTTITVGYTTYTFKTTLAGAANSILISNVPETMAANVRSAIMADPETYGVDHLSTEANPYVEVTNLNFDATVELRARYIGVIANTLATTTTAAAGAFAFTGSVMAGGVNPAAYLAAYTDPILNASSNVARLTRGASYSGEKLQSMNLKIKANVRPKDAIAEIGPWEMGIGSVAVTGDFATYFRTNEIFRQIVEHEYTSLTFILTDSEGKSIAFTLPNVNLGNADPFIQAINTDVMISPAFTAIRHPDYDATVIVNVFP